jgi:hypothetical protein
MRLYVLDDNGKVLFDFSSFTGGCALRAVTSIEEKVRAIVLLKSAVKFLDEQLKGLQ